MEKDFKETIWKFYNANKRVMPWRETTDPYAIFISEVMLQQTQVTRVLEKYIEFLNVFPNFYSLAKASVSEVLSVWSGMGYNRRALFLKKSAEIIVEKYKGILPKHPKQLVELPGIGYATSHSIATFAFNYSGIFIETNIRRVFIQFFFHDRKDVDDKEILSLVEKTVDKDNPREWYYALMDYGAMLAKKVPNPNRKSKHYTVQSKFQGSARQLRGKILKELLEKKQLDKEFFITLENDSNKLERTLTGLKTEGFIMEKKGIYTLK